MVTAPRYPDLGFRSDADFFNNMVRPDMAAFKANPGVREGFHLATSLNHMLDWHWHTLHPGVTNKNQPAWRRMRDAMTAACPALAKVQDLCDASKHCGLDRRDVGLAGVDMKRGAGAAGSYGGTTGGYGMGVLAYGDGRPTLRMLNLDGTTGFWAECFAAAFGHWEALLAARLKSEESANDTTCVKNVVQ